jgi:uncharacterized protein YcsI (UPF0317 family)
MSDALAFRHSVRHGLFQGLTTGKAPGFAQANLVIVPNDIAVDLAIFCQANPRACPLISIGDPGDPQLPGCGYDLDVRTDAPGYILHHKGTDTPLPDLRDVWHGGLTALAIGCWFTAEAALKSAGIRLRHIEQGIQGPLFRTQREAIPAGGLSGPLVVSMRPFATTDADRVAAITAKLPLAHGAPLHRGDPAGIGIPNLAKPDWGEILLPEPHEIPIYWGCGLTALAALLHSGVPSFITHAPGHMLVTDIQEYNR